MKPSDILAAKRDEVLAVIARYPVANPRLFGSVARGEDKEGSDLDILVDITGKMSYFDIVGLEHELIDLLGFHVDVATPGELKKRVLPSVLGDLRPL